jgi:hypothetical protein
MKAILSDIHGNLEALHAVLEDAERCGIEEIYCLGDMVGYGPNPRECLDLAWGWKVVMQGQFDREVLNDPPDFGPTAASATRSLIWSRSQLTMPVPDPQTAEQRWTFLTGLPDTHTQGDFLFVHGSPREPLYEYVCLSRGHLQPAEDARCFRIDRAVLLPRAHARAGDNH